MRKATRQPARGFGAKLKSLRRRKKLDLDEVSEKTGLDVAYLQKIEEQEEIPPVATILRIARALSLDAGDLLKADEAEERAKRRLETLEKRTRSYAYRTLSPGAHHMHLKAFLVTIDPWQDHEKVGYRHEGEEFLYVLKGEVEVRVASRTHKLGCGESLHFDSMKPHTLRNPCGETTELIVVLYTP